VTINPIRLDDGTPHPSHPDQRENSPSVERLGYSLEEFAAAIGIGRTLVYQAAQRGEIPTRRIGRRLIVPVAALDAWFSGDDVA